MTEKHFIIATAGHVDHGKSALVKTLTGTDPDRLPEEKARGITIDLGFANLRLIDGDTAYDVGIVDVPGHEDFVKNMVAGVGAIDIALFVVAADDGWMPQTEEHLHILTYLGIRRAIVALTKSDLAVNLDQSITHIRERLANSPFSDAPIIPTSVVANTGINELTDALKNGLATAPPSRDIGKPRLPVDRVFSLRGVGTIVTGTLMGGTLSRGQPVVVQPGTGEARIRTLQSHNAEIATAQPGSRTALNLPELAANETVRRGDVITISAVRGPAATFDVELHKLGRAAAEKLFSPSRPLKDGVRVRFHHGTGNVPARILFSDCKQLSPGESAIAQLRLEAPIFAFIGDRFIIRDWAEQATLAGGVILDLQGSARKFRSEAQQTFLQTVSKQLSSPVAIVQALIAREHFHRLAELLVQSNFSAAEITTATSQLVSEKKVTQLADWIADTPHWLKLNKAAADTIDAAHKARPDAPGILLSDLRASLGTTFHIPPEIFTHLVAHLSRTGFVQSADKVKRASHQLTLPSHLQAAGAKVRTLLTVKPLDPPSRKELAPDSLTQQALRFLINSGEAVDLGPDVVLHAKAFAQATDIVRKQLAKAAATVSEIRQALGASRRIVVPLLEKLDRDGVTRRDGDKRFLR